MLVTGVLLPLAAFVIMVVVPWLARALR